MIKDRRILMDYQIKRCEIKGLKRPGLLMSGWVDGKVKRLALKHKDTIFFEKDITEGNDNISYFDIEASLPDAKSDYLLLGYTDHYAPILRLRVSLLKQTIKAVQHRLPAKKASHAPAANVPKRFCFDVSDKESYQKWLEKHDIVSRITELSYNPLISLVIPVYNVDAEYLSACLDSILSQSYKNFEICLADDCSTKQETLDTLKEYEAKDTRIHVRYRPENGHISACSNTALADASGEFVGLVDNDDLLAPNALYEVARALNEDRGLDLIYTDEDKLGLDGRREYPHFKSDFAPESFSSGNYLCHFSVIRRSLLNEIGGFRPGYEGAQDFDLLLRVSEHTDRVCHIPMILYYWRMIPTSTSYISGSKNYAADAGKRSLEDYCRATGRDAEIEIRLNTNYFVNYAAPANARLDIILFYHDRVNTLGCLKNLSRYYEKSFNTITIIGKQIARGLPDTLRGNKVPIREINVRSDREAIIALNRELKTGSADYVAFIDDRTRIHADNWAKLLIGYASQEEIGLCATRVHDLNGPIRESGVLLTPEGSLLPANLAYPRVSFGVYGRLSVVFNYSAVNNKCVVAERCKITDVGGFDNNLSLSAVLYDMALRLLSADKRNVYIPEIECTFPEPEKQEIEISEEDRLYLFREWPNAFKSDKYYNPNFSMNEPFQLEL